MTVCDERSHTGVQCVLDQQEIHVLHQGEDHGGRIVKWFASPTPWIVSRRPSHRPSWEQYFLAIAGVVATRADCTRRQVGAVIVKDHRIMATGYNGGAPGGPSCLAGHCPRGQMSKDQVAPGSSYDTGAGTCIALHAEQNAVMYCSLEQRTGATLYITDEPCEGCLRMLGGTGLAEIVWPDGRMLRQPRGVWTRSQGVWRHV